MPVEMGLWRVDDKPVRLVPGGMPTEARLEELIEAEPKRSSASRCSSSAARSRQASGRSSTCLPSTLTASCTCSSSRRIRPPAR